MGSVIAAHYLQREIDMERRAIAPTAPARTPIVVRPQINGIKPNLTLNKIVTTSKFVATGGMLLDCILSDATGPGGWARGRVINIVGDRSTGKTLLAVEACANFALITPIEKIRYVEAEAAFDEDYGTVVGMPNGLRPVDTIRTVEEFFKDLEAFCKHHAKSKLPCLYVLDSLDALSDDSEMKREFGEGSYGTGKAKAMSEAFRRIIRDLELANCTLIILSQIRDKIGVMFGEKKTRSGGTALDFYASQIIWLSELGKVKRTVSGVERVLGIDVRIRNRKNKLGLPHREAEQTMLFNYGIDDETSMLKFLIKTKVIGSATSWMDAVHAARIAHDKMRLVQLNGELRKLVWGKWTDIEKAVAPVGGTKYG